MLIKKISTFMKKYLFVSNVSKKQYLMKSCDNFLSIIKGNRPEKNSLEALSMVLTRKCNLNCDYCLRDAKVERAEEVEFRLLKDIILTAHHMGCRRCCLTGGEAFLYSKFNDLINLLGDLEWEALVETNGKILDSSKCIFLKEKLGNRLSMSVSLDSHRKEIHDSLRGKGSFDAAVKAINLIKGYSIKLETNTIITSQEENDILALVKFNKELKVDLMHANRVVPVGRGRNDKFLMPNNKVIFYNKIFRKYNNFDGYFSGSAFGLNNGYEKMKCQKFIKQICISPDGIHPCVALEKVKVGELDDFNRIIRDKKLKEFLWSAQEESFKYYREKGLLFSCVECVEILPKILKTRQ